VSFEIYFEILIIYTRMNVELLFNFIYGEFMNDIVVCYNEEIM